MSFKFYPIESKIFDLLIFPACAIFTEKNEEALKSSNYTELIPEASLLFYKQMESALVPYKSDILRFYFEELSMPSLVTKQYPVFGYANEQAYFTFLRGLSDEDLLRTYLTKIALVESDDDTLDDAALETLVHDVNAQLTLIESLSTPDDEKWRLSNLIRQQKKSCHEWLDLMETLIPIFEVFYQEKASSVMTFGDDLVRRLDETHGTVLSEISFGILTVDLLPSEHLLVSMIDAYNIEINSTSFIPYTRLGVYIEEFFKQLQNAQESELKERVLTYKNLGDKTRYEVIKLIASGVESAKEIAKQLNVSQATISYHISNLTTSKILILKKENGKYINVINYEWLMDCHKKMLTDFGYDNL